MLYIFPFCVFYIHYPLYMFPFVFYVVMLVFYCNLQEFPKICQMKGCEKLRRFLRSIQNHIYWTAASSANGPERVAKWTSILNHVQDKHTEKKKQRQEQMAGCW